MSKCLANRLYTKLCLYYFKIQDGKGIEDQIDVFIKILDDLENIEVKLDEEDKARILLNALRKSYENFKDAMLYGRDQSISLDEVQSAIQSKELHRRLLSNTEPLGEGLSIRGRSDKRTPNT